LAQPAPDLTAKRWKPKAQSPSINVAPNITLDCFQAVVDDEGYVQGFDRLKITWSIAASTFRLLRAGWLYPKARVTLRAMYGGNSSIRAKLLIELEILLTATGSMAEGTK
jgi:hypothetical protein